MINKTTFEIVVCLTPCKGTRVLILEMELVCAHVPHSLAEISLINTSVHIYELGPVSTQILINPKHRSSLIRDSVIDYSLLHSNPFHYDYHVQIYLYISLLSAVCNYSVLSLNNLIYLLVNFFLIPAPDIFLNLLAFYF